MLPISEKDLQNVLKDMDISDINHATIRQCVNVAHELEHISGDKFVHLEFGIPGINACEVGIAAQKKALYTEYRSAQEEMRQAVAVKANIDHLLGVTDGQRKKEQER